MAVQMAYAGLTIPAASALNSVAAPRPLPAAGARALVPLVYGQDQVAGLILNVLLASAGSTTLLVQVLWCHACNSVGTPRLNDRALSAGTTATHYTGSQGTAHAALVTAFAAQGITYTDTLAGYAYSVFAMPVREFEGQLNFSAVIQGRKLYDPRLDSTNGGVGSHRLATPSTWAYSTNPSLALADWLYSSAYGANDPPLWSSVITAANANDALIGTPSETHRTINVSFTAATPVPAMKEALRAYAGVWLVPTATGIKLLPDATAASVATYSHASGQIAAIEPLTLRDLGNSPTAVEVVYTDNSQVPYRDASAFAQLSGAGTTLPWRLSTVRLPGVQRYGQAVREATERLNKLTLSDLSTTLEVFDVGIAHEPADIVTVSHPVGLVSKLFRLNAPPEMAGPGRWRLALSEYDPAVYSTAVATAPTYSDTGKDISAAADGAIVTFWQTTAPATGAEGDLWFDTDDGSKLYRYTSGSWVVAADTRIATAITNAAGAQATADGKVTTFVTTAAPTAQGVGDLWLDSDDSFKMYRWSGSAWVAVADARIATALADAAAAQTAANTANTTLANIASDSLLTPDEKPRVILERDVIVAEQGGIDAQATAYGITTTKTTYDTAVTALTTYLATLTTPVLWSNLGGNTTIVGATFRTKFSDVYIARQALLNAIAAEAGTVANWSELIAKPADSELITRLGQFSAIQAWDFLASLDGWTSSGGSLTAYSTFAEHISTGIDPMMSVGGLAISGAASYCVRARVFRAAGSGWDGSLYYSTAGHSWSGSFYKNISDSTVLNQWVVLEWDMRALTAGGSDWTSSTITGLRIDLGNTSGDTFYIDWIEVGSYAGHVLPGAVGTPQIAAEAATTVVTDYVEQDNRSSTSTYHLICGAALTNTDTVARTMLVSCTMTMAFPFGIAAGNFVRGHMLPSTTLANSGNFKFQHEVKTGEDLRWQWSAQEQVTVAAGATVTWGLWGWASNFTPDVYYQRCNLRLELIKK